MNPHPMPETAPASGWHFTPDDWDELLPPLRAADMLVVDAAVRGIILRRIGRRHGPSGIRARLVMVAMVAVDRQPWATGTPAIPDVRRP